MSKKLKRPSRYFQYIDGEEKGKVVELKDIFEESGELFYSFDDGESINSVFISPMTTSISTLKNKFLVEIQSPRSEYMWRFQKVSSHVVDLGNGDSTTAPPLEDLLRRGMYKDENGNYIIEGDSMLGKDKILFPLNNDIKPQEIKPLPELDWFYDPNDIEEEVEVTTPPQTKRDFIPVDTIFEPEGDLGSDGPMELVTGDEAEKYRDELIQCTESCQQVQIEPETSEDEKAVSILIKKTKKHETEIPITLIMSLPSKSLYSIVCDEFENGSELFVNEVVKSLTDIQIKDAIKSGLKVAYKDAEDEQM